MKLYNVKEAAEYLGVSRAYVYILARFGVIKPIKSKPILFIQRDLDEFNNKRSKKNGTTTQERT